MNRIERISMVKAMEYIIRNLNDEELVNGWLASGVADGDIEYGDLQAATLIDDESIDYYIEDDNFADLMYVFLSIMHVACKFGGLCCDGIVDKSSLSLK